MITVENYREAVSLAEEDMAEAMAAKDGPTDQDEYDRAVVDYLNEGAAAQNRLLADVLMKLARFWDGEVGERAVGRANAYRGAAGIVSARADRL